MKAAADLTEAEAVEALAALADEIAAHDLRYFRDEAPAISDGDYDALKRRNAEIEARFPHLARENSPSLRVGAARAESFAPAPHGVPMLSLDNAFSDGDAAEFDARVRRFLRLSDDPVAYVAEPKIDGLSASLRYEKGRLVRGATRGDGRIGEGEATRAAVEVLAPAAREEEIARMLSGATITDAARAAARALMAA